MYACSFSLSYVAPLVSARLPSPPHTHLLDHPLLHAAAHKVPAGQQVEIVEWLTNLKSQLQFETGHRLYRDVLLSAATDSDTSPTLSAGVPSGLVDSNLQPAWSKRSTLCWHPSVSPHRTSS